MFFVNATKKTNIFDNYEIFQETNKFHWNIVYTQRLLYFIIENNINSKCNIIIILFFIFGPSVLFRSHKRYYYQNRTTGVSQWEYPQPDIQTCDDAMDISTTPPPEQVITMSPPLPPAIRSPTPPPPPIISGSEENLENTGKM